MMDYLDFLSRYVMTSLEMLMGFWFFTGFLQKKGKPICCILFGVLGMSVLEVFNLQGFFAILVFILFLIAARRMLYRADFVSTVLYAVVTVEIMSLCFGLSNSLSYLLFPFVLEKSPRFFGFILMGAGNILALVLAFLCYRGVQKCCGCDETADKKYVFVILMPVLLIFLASAYINETIYGNTMTTEKERMLSGVNPYQVLLMQALGAASLFCILFSYKRLSESFRLHREAAVLERQTQKAEAALQYVEEMENLTADISFPVSTNHPVLDILLGNKLGIAEENRIEVQCSLTVPYPCGISDIDFCIILGNALDNAIFACNRIDSGKPKYIHVSGKVQGDFLLIEIENSCIGRTAVREGTGITNIRAAVEKYQGALEIRTEGEKITVSILLIIPRHSESTSQQMG